MTGEEVRAETEEKPPLALDPFAFHGHPVSCIQGLGGNAPIPDPSYAFHTDYVPVARGRAHFHLRFENLHAKQGTLWLRVHMLPVKPGAVARMVTSERVPLNRLAHIGGELSLRFEAFRGANYALMGLVMEQTDATADGLAITLDRPGDPAEWGEGDELDEGSETAFGTQALKTPGLLLSLEPPQLAAPVSQVCTSEQLREKGFVEWRRALGAEAAEEADAVLWQRAYVLQALATYGLLQPGARGACIGEDSHALVPALERAGVEPTLVRLADEPAPGLEERPVRTLRAEEIGDTLMALDFLCSIRVSDRFGNANAAAAFLERLMESLRPGGLAVHVIAYRPSPMNEPAAGPLFNRGAVERLALGLISRGHDVARVKLALGGRLVPAPGPTGESGIPFGIVSRRARSIL